MKRILSFVLCLTMIMSFASVVNAEHYSKFTDVKPDSWYYEDVDNAVRLGIINGKSETTFAPDDNLTYAEAIKLAACMYQLYKDGSVYLVSGGNPWYETYVNYAKDHGIITDNFFEKVNDINEKATRAGYMEIFASALPNEALECINNVPDGSIPDVPMVHESAIGIYKLYRAGILTGVDANHNCKPEDNIKRCEVAAIITRMMDETKRVKFSMGTNAEEPKTEEPKLEIPKDAEFAPEIKEDEASIPKAETPDMYEPFEIAVQPLQIDGADEGEKLEYTVKATGGKTPYAYQWVSRGWHNQTTAISDSEYAKGTKNNTLTMIFDIDNPYTSQFRCKVTDALGQEVISDYVTLPEQAFIFKPEDVIKYNSGYIFTGRVEKGALRAGETVSMHMPSHGIEVFGVATKIEMFKKSIDEVKENYYCGILIEEPEEIPYDSWVVDNLGETLATRLVNMGNYGFKAWMHVTPCIYSADVGDKSYVQVNVFGGKAPYTYEWYKSENSGDYTELKSDNKYKVDEGKVEILVDEAEFSKCMIYKCIVTDAMWAANEDITGGTSANTFSPDVNCSRGQVVTFLHRMIGSPEPAAITLPFADVKTSDYFYKPVKWAYGSKITGGTSDTTFSPDVTCTRGQVVTFLWRTAGQPEAKSNKCNFTDVKSDSYYYKAVLWAVEQGITGGTSATTFSPEDSCTRGQVVTFLYRFINGQ